MTKEKNEETAVLPPLTIDDKYAHQKEFNGAVRSVLEGIRDDVSGGGEIQLLRYSGDGNAWRAIAFAIHGEDGLAAAPERVYELAFAALTGAGYEVGKIHSLDDGFEFAVLRKGDCVNNSVVVSYC